jgi:hypothetical protein
MPAVDHAGQWLRQLSWRVGMSANALRQSAARMTTSQTRVSTDPQLNACESAFAISPGCGAAAPGFRVRGSTIIQTSFHPLFG